MSRHLSAKTKAMCDIFGEGETLPRGVKSSESAARLASVSIPTLYAAMRRGELRPIAKLGKLYWWDSEVVAWATPQAKGARAAKKHEAARKVAK